MSSDAEPADIIGVNWGSSAFRAYRMDRDGLAMDEYSAPMGIAALDRYGMAAAMDGLTERWPGHGPVYAAGMIGSNIGWIEAPYAEAPAGIADLANALVPSEIGSVPVHIVPGIACTRAFDGAPDVLRGEETELLGLAARDGGDGMVALPGTHTKWVRMERGRIVDFITAMSGEIFDRLTAQGLLASIVDGEASAGVAFTDGVTEGRAQRLGLASLLFGARARVIRGELARSDAASYIRGLLIGAEVADAMALQPDMIGSVVPLIGNGPLSKLYAEALATIGVRSRLVDSRAACLSGFSALHRARATE